MIKTPEIVRNYAAITPLDRPEIVGKLLDRVPDFHDAVLRTYGTYVQTRAQIRGEVGELLSQAGLGEDFRAAVMIHDAYESPVRVWLDIKEQELKLLDFFNFAPDWQRLEDVTHLILPQPVLDNNYQIFAHRLRGAPFVRRARSKELTRYLPDRQSYQLGMEPLMGLGRMVLEAGEARRVFLESQQPG